MKKIISKSVQNAGLAFAMVVVLVLPSTPLTVQAADLSGGTYDYYDYTPSYSTYDYYDYTPSYSTYDYYDYTPSYSTYDYYDYTPSYSTYDYYDYTPSYSTYDYYDYTPSYSTYDYYDYTPSYSTYDYYDYTPSYSSSYYSSPGYYSIGSRYSYDTYTPPSGCKKNCNPPKKEPKPTCELWATKTHIERGESTTLKWESRHADSVKINQGIGSVDDDGSRTVSPDETTTYTGTFKGDGGTVTCSETIVVEKKRVEHKRPQCEMWVSDAQIERGDRVTLSWSSKNVDEVRINNGIGSVDEDGSETVRPDESTTYVGTFYGVGGDSIKCSAKVTVERDHYVPPPTAPYVTLDSVPYTGLDLGPAGTAVYWSFLILWSLLAAYLIAVKRVHNAIYRSLKRMLYGSDAVVTHVSVVPAHPVALTHSDAENRVASRLTHPVVPSQTAETEGVDPFILSQINRKLI